MFEAEMRRKNRRIVSNLLAKFYFCFYYRNYMENYQTIKQSFYADRVAVCNSIIAFSKRMSDLWRIHLNPYWLSQPAKKNFSQNQLFFIDIKFSVQTFRLLKLHFHAYLKSFEELTKTAHLARKIITECLTQ